MTDVLFFLNVKLILIILNLKKGQNSNLASDFSSRRTNFSFLRYQWQYLCAPLTGYCAIKSRMTTIGGRI